VEYVDGDIGGAINAARAVDPARLPAPERRARYRVDLARVYDRWGGHRPQVVSALRRAYAEAPGEVTSRPVVRELARGAGISV
jgi:hypothetical protein